LVLSWQRDLGNRCHGAIVLRGGRSALVIAAGRRIRADHQQIFAAGKPLVACSGRQYCDVAGLEAELFSTFATEANLCMAARDAKHLVRPRVVVHVIVNAVSPRITPAIACEQLFKYRRRIKSYARETGLR
jgi:hypothetical protein